MKTNTLAGFMAFLLVVVQMTQGFVAKNAGALQSSRKIGSAQGHTALRRMPDLPQTLAAVETGTIPELLRAASSLRRALWVPHAIILSLAKVQRIFCVHTSQHAAHPHPVACLWVFVLQDLCLRCGRREETASMMVHRHHLPTLRSSSAHATRCAHESYYDERHCQILLAGSVG